MKYLITLLFFLLSFPLLAQTPKASELYRKGEATMLKRDYKKAINFFQKSIKLRPETCATYRPLGTCYDAIDEYEEAIKAYEKVVDCNPYLSRVIYYDIALVYYKAGDLSLIHI